MEKIKPMLATLAKEPFDSPKHIFEIKWDGARAIAFVEKGKLRLQSRYLRNITSQFPELARLPLHLKTKNAVLDGEIVVLDERGISSFEGIQNRIHKTKEIQFKGAMKHWPATLIIFDLLFKNGQSLMEKPLIERKERLQDLVEPSEKIRVTEFIEREGIRLFEAAKSQGMEGIMAKEKISLYLPGHRSRSWRKFKIRKEGWFVIGGWEVTSRVQKDLFGALLLGQWNQGGGFCYVGKVGTGFSQATLEKLSKLLRENETEICPFLNPPEENRFWCKPVLECEVRYQEMTSGGKLRQASFRRLKGEEIF